MSDVTGEFYPNESGIGYGTELGVGQGDGTPETFVSVPVLMKITPGDLTTGIVDATHLRSPKRHREKKGTLRDSGANRLGWFSRVRFHWALRWSRWPVLRPMRAQKNRPHRTSYWSRAGGSKRLAHRHRPSARSRAGLTRTYWPTTTSLICITGLRSV
jgi:hypothetical protein